MNPDKSVPILTMSRLNPSYSQINDVVIWAVASPQRLRDAMKESAMPEEVVLPRNAFLKAWDKGFYSAHKTEFENAADKLCDDYSKQVFWAYLAAQNGEIADDVRLGTDGTYFNELTRDRRNGAFVDCGAYNGDSARAYYDFYGRIDEKLFLFEPDPENFRKLACSMKDDLNVVCVNKGTYSHDGTLSFSANADMSSSLQESGNDTVEVTTIDHVVGDVKVGFIKMDVEGAELESLKGARKVIERDMPILAISAYHRQEDLLTLIPFLCELDNGCERYDLYLRHHGIFQTELVLYGLPVFY